MGKIKITEAIKQAVLSGDSAYVNEKGAKEYQKGNYEEAVEYYRLAMAMGNVNAVSNLGYCYLYGRHIEKDLDLAIQYLTVASKRGSVDGTYKLGDIYGSDKWGKEDKELSVYYYVLAMDLISEGQWRSIDFIMNCEELQYYPSLAYALGRELSSGGEMMQNLDLAFAFLLRARNAYEEAIRNGDQMYQKCLEGVEELLDDPRFEYIVEMLESGEEDDGAIIEN